MTTPTSARERESTAEREVRALAHELKTPLAIVFGYATTLLQQDLPEDSRRWFLGVIADQSRRLLRAIDRMEELNGLEAGVRTDAVDLVARTRAAAERAAAASPGADIEGPTGSVAAVSVRAADPWLELALEEALVACAAAAGEGGTVRIAAPARDHDGVRLDITTTPPTEPHGLGSYLARRIAEALGAEVEQVRGRLSFVFPAG